MRCGLILIALALLSPIGISATIFVPDHYTTIQGAINASSNGDTVIIRPGTYYENIDFVGRTILLKSEQGAAVTTIDGSQSGSVVTFQSGENADSVLDGFEVTNGTGTPDFFGNLNGGGIYCDAASPTIRNNTISRNSAYFGGGIFCSSTSVVIMNNAITNNLVLYDGGGLFCYPGSFPNIVNNIISGNSARRNGGGIDGDYSFLTITNNTISRNSAGAGGGISCYDSQTRIRNTILWGNSAGTGKEISLEHGSALKIEFSDVEGGQLSAFYDTQSTLFWGSGMIDSDPLFVDPAIGDYHIPFDSPCLSAGNNNSVPPALLRDFEGDPRVHQNVVDIGADEFHTHLYHLGSVQAGQWISIRVIGDPAEPVTLAQGSGVQDPPYQTAWGYGYLQLPIMSQVGLGFIPADGVLTLTAAVPGSWQTGEEYPFQALVGLFVTGSRLTNLMVLAVE